MPDVAQGFISTAKGMDGGTHPALLPDGYISNGVNIAVRDGRAMTRPGFTRLDVTLPQGLFQGAARWSLNSGDRLVMVVAGEVLALHLDTLVVTSLGVLLDVSAQCYFHQPDRFLVIQDGISTPVILQDVAGVPQRYVYPSGTPDGYKMPIGTLAHFAHQRVHMVPNVLPGYPDSNGGPYFISGDVLFAYDPQSCLTFEENTYWATGGAHSLPAEMGYVTGMSALRNAATGTGVGSLIVFGRRGASAFDLSIPRDQWNTVNTSQVLFFDAGTVSPWAILPINNDLFYRGIDGFRFMSYTYSQAQGNSGALSNLPKSKEVREYVENEDAALLPYVSAASWDQRLLVTAGGQGDRYFKALVSLDLAPLYGFQGAAAPAYDGIWTGLSFAQILTAERGGVNEVFVLTEGPEIYRIDKDATSDDGNPIEAMVITKAFDFQQPQFRKQLSYADLWVSELLGDVSIDVYYRPVGYPLWALMATREVKAPAVAPAQTRSRLRFALDSYVEACDASTGAQLRTAVEFQFAIVWRGRMRLDKFMCVASQTGEEPPSPCGETVEAAAIVPDASTGIVELDVYRYQVEGT